MTTAPVQKGKKSEIIFVELCDMRDSGWVRDGTEGTKYEEKLTSPSVHFIPNISYRYVDKVVGGKPERVLEEIRHINKRDDISVLKQNELGIKPSPRSYADKILLRNGRASFAKEGANRGMFNFLVDNVEFNASNPELLPSARPIYKIVDLEKQQEAQNELSILQNEASAAVFALQTKKGGEWVYQEDKINSWCNLFAVHAETPSMKIKMLAETAKLYPKDFLDTILKFEQTTSILVSHALQLDVIHFSGNVALYRNKDKAIKNLGVGNMAQDEKIDLLGQYLRSSEGHEAFNELTAEVELAKEKKSKQ